MKQVGVAIFGAGHAGVECALALRTAGFTGSVSLIGREPGLPYDRPPLSKSLLGGSRSVEQISLKTASLYDEHGIDRVAGLEVTSLDAQAREFGDSSGERWRFDFAVIATGARARQLPGLSGSGAHSIRSLADVAALRAELVPGKHLVVVGAGYLGLEAAGTAASLGVRVTVIEHAASIMPGRVSKPTAARLLSLQQAHGVRVMTDCDLVRWDRDRSGEWLATLGGGLALRADLVLVAIGAVPDCALAESAGLLCSDGIWVDADCRTSAADVYAIGDCASMEHPQWRRRVRIESVNNALTQARTVAAAIAGKPRPEAKPPTFWSEQCGRRLQMAGMVDPDSAVHDELFETARGWIVERWQRDSLQAIEAVDSPVEFMKGIKRLNLPAKEMT